MSNFAEINYDKNMQMLDEAFEYYNETYSHEEIIKVLSEDNDLKKQNCLILLDSILSQNEADILVSNLTGHSGPVRETASYKILDLIKDKTYRPFFQHKKILDSFVNAVTDINPGVSRSTTEIIKHVDNHDYLYNKFILKIKDNITALEKIEKNNSYVANKVKFALYWNLEALSGIISNRHCSEELDEIINKTAESEDYTIREKTAKLISLTGSENKKISRAADLLRNDSNIYVRKYFS